jgi:uncharacterized membrane protein
MSPSTLALIHAALALVFLPVGLVVLARRKGDARHKQLGWVFVGFMLASLIAVAAAGILRAPSFLETPAFNLYALLMIAALVGAVAASRLRLRFASWRVWHGVLMSTAIMGALIAFSGVIGGLLIGDASGPAYYRMFNVIIVVYTLIGLWLINTRAVIWGVGDASARHTPARVWLNALVVASSAALVVGQIELM